MDQLPLDLMTPAQAAEMLGVPAKTLAAWRLRGSVKIPYAKVGRLVRYRRSDLEAFIASNIVD